ncbi:unnamed protein product, partial [Ectocarpus sp. 12 AP-2014]
EKDQQQDQGPQRSSGGSGSSLEDEEDESRIWRRPRSRLARVKALLQDASSEDLSAAFRDGDITLRDIVSTCLSSDVPRPVPPFDLDMSQEEISRFPPDDYDALLQLSEHWHGRVTEDLHAKAEAVAEKAAAEEAAAAAAARAEAERVAAEQAAAKQAAAEEADAAATAAAVEEKAAAEQAQFEGRVRKVQAIMARTNRLRPGVLPEEPGTPTLFPSPVSPSPSTVSPRPPLSSSHPRPVGHPRMPRAQASIDSSRGTGAMESGRAVDTPQFFVTLGGTSRPDPDGVHEKDVFAPYDRRSADTAFLHRSVGMPSRDVTFHEQDQPDADTAWGACRQFVLDAVRPTPISQVTFSTLFNKGFIKKLTPFQQQNVSRLAHALRRATFRDGLQGSALVPPSGGLQPPLNRATVTTDQRDITSSNYGKAPQLDSSHFSRGSGEGRNHSEFAAPASSTSVEDSTSHRSASGRGSGDGVKGSTQGSRRNPRGERWGDLPPTDNIQSTAAPSKKPRSERWGDLPPTDNSRSTVAPSRKPGGERWGDLPQTDKTRSTAVPSRKPGSKRWGDLPPADNSRSTAAPSSKPDGERWGDLPPTDNTRSTAAPSTKPGSEHWGDQPPTDITRTRPTDTPSRKPGSERWGDQPPTDSTRSTAACHLGRRNIENEDRRRSNTSLPVRRCGRSRSRSAGRSRTHRSPPARRRSWSRNRSEDRSRANRSTFGRR